MFGLTAEGLVGQRGTARLNAIQSNYVGKVADLSVPQLILSFVPKNPFADLSVPQLILSFVPKNPFADLTGLTQLHHQHRHFSAFLGVAALKLLKEDVEKASAC